MNTHFTHMATVMDRRHRERQTKPMNVVQLTLRVDGSTYEVIVENTDWTVENPWLKLLGYAGCCPSNVDDCFVGQELPVQKAGDNVEIPKLIFGNGKHALSMQMWAPNC